MRGLSAKKRFFFVECGRRGGALRARRLSATERVMIASKAAKARWKKDPALVSILQSVRLSRPSLDNPVFLDEWLSDGTIDQWALLYQVIADRPFGAVADALEKVLFSSPLYGVTPLWKGILNTVRGGAV